MNANFARGDSIWDLNRNDSQAYGRGSALNMPRVPLVLLVFVFSMNLQEMNDFLHFEPFVVKCNPDLDSRLLKISFFPFRPPIEA